MTETTDFEALVERVVQAGAGTLDRMRPVIAKELLHYDILFALESESLLDSITFQGIGKKLADYKIADYAAKADRMIEQLPEIVHGNELKQQMERFIQQDVRERTLLKDKFLTVLQDETIGLLTLAKMAGPRISPPRSGRNRDGDS